MLSLLLALALVPTSSAVPPAVDRLKLMPPAHYRGDAAASVVFRDQSKLEELCGKAPTGKMWLGCQEGKTVVLPNPCPYADREWYAFIVCHEVGHLNGWKATDE